MTVGPEELVDPRDAFLATDPGQAFLDAGNPENFLLQDPLGAVDGVTIASTRAYTVAAIALSLSAAFLVVRAAMSSQMAAQGVPGGDPYQLARSVWTKVAPLWLRMTVPAVTHAFELGAVDLASMTPGEVQVLATEYAASLGEHINETSATALSEGFNAQLAGGWNERLAWQRATAAYGLDSAQMRAFASSKVGLAVYAGQPLDDATRAGVNKALLTRADRFGGNETHAAIQMGKSVSWMAASARGEIDPSSTKIWLTAEDEKVCPECGPMHQQVQPLHKQFETPSGMKLWGPGVHPNCRCEIDLQVVYPDTGYVEKSFRKTQPKPAEKVAALSQEVEATGVKKPHTATLVGRLVLRQAKKKQTDGALIAKAFGADKYNRDRGGQFSRNEERHAQRMATIRAAEAKRKVKTLDRPVVADAQLRSMIDEALSTVTDPFTTKPQLFDETKLFDTTLPFDQPDLFTEVKPELFTEPSTELFTEVKPQVFDADPFAEVAPGHQRVVIIINGKKTPVDIPVDPDPPKPPRKPQEVMLASASAYRAAFETEVLAPSMRGHDPEDIEELSDYSAMPFQRGDMIDFDRWSRLTNKQLKRSGGSGDARFIGASFGTKPGQTNSMRHLISSEAGIINDSQDDLASDLPSEDDYYIALGHMRDAAAEQVEDIVGRMDPAEIDSICLDAGIDIDKVSRADYDSKRARIIEAIDDGEHDGSDALAEAFFEWTRENIPVGDSNFKHIAAEYEAHAGLMNSVRLDSPRVLEIFTFPEGYDGHEYMGGSGDSRAPIITGQYRVRRTRVRTAWSTFGSDASDVSGVRIPAWREVELVPLDSVDPPDPVWVSSPGE